MRGPGVCPLPSAQTPTESTSSTNDPRSGRALHGGKGRRRRTHAAPEARAPPVTAPLREDKRGRAAGPGRRSTWSLRPGDTPSGRTVVPCPRAVQPCPWRLTPARPRRSLGRSSGRAMRPTSNLVSFPGPPHRAGGSPPEAAAEDRANSTRMQCSSEVQALPRQASVLTVCPFVSFFPPKGHESNFSTQTAECTVFYPCLGLSERLAALQKGDGRESRERAAGEGRGQPAAWDAREGPPRSFGFPPPTGAQPGRVTSLPE